MSNVELIEMAETILASVKRIRHGHGVSYECNVDRKQWNLKEPYELAKFALATLSHDEAGAKSRFEECYDDIRPVRSKSRGLENAEV